MMVDWEAVVGTGSLKLANLRQNLKLLQERQRNLSTGQLPEVSCCSRLSMTSLGGHTYPSALLKVNESSL